MRVIGDGGHAAVVREIIEACGAKIGIVVAIGDNKIRKRETLAHPGAYVCLIHPKAIVSPSAIIGAGSVVMAGAIVGANAYIGKHCIVNHGATVDHHCVLGDYVHIAPGAHLCGGVQVGEGTLVGVGVAIAPSAKIPAWSFCKARRLEIESLASR